jgi:adenylate cyclase
MVVLAALLLVPLAGLGLLLAEPDLDAEWDHQPTHFWLVLGVAAANVALGLLASEAARRLEDVRLFLVSMAFLTSAGFLGLHALATPGVLLDSPNTGFVVATPIGLLLAGGFAAASAVPLAPRLRAEVVRRRTLLRNLLLLLIGAWAAVSVAQIAPLDEPLPDDEAEGPLLLFAVVGVVLYGFAALRYLVLYRERRARMLLALTAAFALLAEAMVAIAFARNWHASWWEWHVLMAIAFGLVALTAREEYRSRRSLTGIFSDVFLHETIERVDRRYGEALRRVVDGDRPPDDLSADESALLEKAAGEIRRLDDLFRPYLSPQLTERLRADPSAAALGGERREVSILFADLEGFTAFSERNDPGDVVGMLNEYWAEAVPAVAEQGGMIERFAGDAVLVVFNAGGDQPDHAVRASRAALQLQRASGRVSARRPDWPRFRAGVNTGTALIGNVGSLEQRSFTAIGDTTNLASRLQSSAEPGKVVIAGETRARLGDAAVVERLQPLELKGKSEAIEAFVLVELAENSR